ncbi:MAG: hypothetical protein HY340_00405 [Candidatus Kerfeldbacteria bacterium]|nr:hypothetical protein [Candidatus Kerfeldbacteria bacterium]
MTQQPHSTTARGVAILGLVLAGAALLLVVVAVQMLFARSSASTRDLRRLTDMREAETLFQRLYRATGSYGAAAQDGCATEGSALAACNAVRIGGSFRHLTDPRGGPYRVTTPPSDIGFAVSFVLEKSYGTLAAGEHVLTQEGIR